MKTEQTDVLIIGAGPSGSVAAGILQQKGINTIIVEREQFPRFVIGESLLPGCMQPLDDAGLIDDLKKMGFQEKTGALFLRGTETCDFSFEDQFSDGWNWTWQVPRADFDKCMTDNLQRRGVDIRFRHSVTDIKIDGTDSVTTVEDAEGNKTTIQAKFIIDASGYGRVIPRMFGLDRPSELHQRKTYLVHLTDTRRMEYQQPNRIHAVIQGKDSWIWVIPFASGLTSLGFVRLPELFPEETGDLEKYFRGLIADEPILAERFKDQEIKLGPRILKAWSISTSCFYGDGFVLTGNATEFLDPIFSSGVTMAVVSSSLAANLIADQMNGRQVNWEKEYKDALLKGVEVFKTYIKGWYTGELQKIFFTPMLAPKIKSQICSVLAGYVWDDKNPFVRSHNESFKNLVRLIEENEAANG